MQHACVILPTVQISFELPDPRDEVLSGVPWGEATAFPTPAYWAYQVLARRVTGRDIRYRLGSTLREEVGACLLGGHGLPAAVGVAAFEHLKRRGAFGDVAPEAEVLAAWLREPLEVAGRTIHYRFAAQKGRYLAQVLTALEAQVVPKQSRALRDWLMALPGIGPKTASWIVRNHLDADDVAILDIHVLRAGVLGGFFDPSLRVERDYAALEARFLEFSAALGVRAAELDAVIWWEMAQSRSTVDSLLQRMPPGALARRTAGATRAHARQTHAA